MGSGRNFLPRYSWLLIGPPFLAFIVANWILAAWGGTEFEVARPLAADGHLEAAGRLRTLATFLLYVAFAIGSIVYALCIGLRVASKHRTRLLGACLATLAAGAAAVAIFGLDKGDRYAEIALACASFELLHPQDPRASSDTQPQTRAPSPRLQAQGGTTSPRQPAAGEQSGPANRAPRPVQRTEAPSPEPRGEAADPQVPEAPPRGPRSDLICKIASHGLFEIPAHRENGSNSYRQLRLTYAYAALLLILATPVLVWGAIACLALPRDGSARQRHAAWARQTESLNRLLYITAAFLIAGLFYASARWNWPAYSLHPADAAAYREHVRSLILYLGVLNSVLIASYYLPVAALLAASEPESPRAGAPAAAAEESRNPFAAYRTVLTILSPAILGLLGELLKFTP